MKNPCNCELQGFQLNINIKKGYYMSENTQKQVVHEKPSQKNMVKNILLAGKVITQADFIKLTGNLSARLAPRIKNLRDDGFPIINLTEYERDENGSNKPAEYVLNEFFLQNVEDYGLEIALKAEQLLKGTENDLA